MPGIPFQHLEKRYFRDGDTGFRVWDSFGGRVGMAICNDRRWPETYRVMALRGADLVVLGYNSPAQLPDWPDQNEHRALHHLLPMLQHLGAGDAELHPGMTRPMAVRDVLLRLQRNLVQRRLAAHELQAALRSLEGMLLVAPEVMTNWLQAAELSHQLGHAVQAVRCLERVVAAAPGSDVARRAQARLDAWGKAG